MTYRLKDSRCSLEDLHTRYGFERLSLAFWGKRRKDGKLAVALRVSDLVVSILAWDDVLYPMIRNGEIVTEENTDGKE
jgi:hypothetical protein